MVTSTEPNSLLADVRLLGSDESSNRLGDFWQDQPVVFVWLRHYG